MSGMVDASGFRTDLNDAQWTIVPGHDLRQPEGLDTAGPGA